MKGPGTEEEFEEGMSRDRENLFKDLLLGIVSWIKE